MTRILIAMIIAVMATSCGPMVMTKTGFNQSSDLPPFFPEVAASQFEQAYELLCPPIRNATEYSAFISMLNAHPYARLNSGFSTYNSQAQLGSGVTTYTGWLTTSNGVVPAEMIARTTDNGPCLLAVTILGSSILPPFRISGD